MATNKEPLVTVLGSLNVDLVAYVSHHPASGETMTSSSFNISSGGKGANQAVACAKLSRPRPSVCSEPAETAMAKLLVEQYPRVRMVGAVGTDAFGELLLKDLHSYGVDTAYVVRHPQPIQSGMAVIIVDTPTGQNRIILAPLANHSWAHLSCLQMSADEMLGVLGPQNPDLLIMQLEIPVPVVLSMLRVAKQKGVPVLLNPAPAVKLPVEALDGLEHLVVNETEATEQSGLPPGELNTESKMEEVASIFALQGVRNIIITLGGKGVYYMAAGGTKKGLVPATTVNVVDTTAAGDTFIGQYALEVIAKKTFEISTAIVKANRAAGKTVERRGAQISIPWQDEM